MLQTTSNRDQEWDFGFQTIERWGDVMPTEKWDRVGKLVLITSARSPIPSKSGTRGTSQTRKNCSAATVRASTRLEAAQCRYQKRFEALLRYLPLFPPVKPGGGGP